MQLSWCPSLAFFDAADAEAGLHIVSNDDGLNMVTDPAIHMQEVLLRCPSIQQNPAWIVAGMTQLLINAEPMLLSNCHLYYQVRVFTPWGGRLQSHSGQTSSRQTLCSHHADCTVTSTLTSKSQRDSVNVSQQDSRWHSVLQLYWPG